MPNMIELDISQPWTLEDETDRLHRPRPGLRAVMLAVLLVAVLTGPALFAASGLSQLWRATADQGFFLLTDDAVYTVEHYNERMLLYRQDPQTGQVVWSTLLDGPLAEAYGSGQAALITRFPPVGRADGSTKVSDSTDGQALWSYPVFSAPLLHVAGDIGALIDREPIIRTGGGAIQNDFSDGSDRPHRVTVLDLKTGQERIRHRIPKYTSWALPGLMPGDEGLTSATAANRWIALFDLGGPAPGTGTAAEAAERREPGLLEIRDLEDWSLTAIRRIEGDFGDRSYVFGLPDAVLVRTESPDGPVFTAYDAKDLSVRWSFTATELFGTPYACGLLLCIDNDQSLWAYDPYTGHRAWRQPNLRVRPFQADTPLLATQFGTALSVVDAATGEARQILGEWRVVDPVNYTNLAVVARGTNDGGGAEVGILTVRTGIISHQTTVSTWSGSLRCHASTRILACVEDDELRVWRVNA